MKLFEKLKNHLTFLKIPFKHIQHAPTLTSEESATARGESIDVGAKALVMKVDDLYHLFVMSASKKIDSKKIKNHFKCKSLRFATQEELFEQTTLTPGSVPPFGQPILPYALYIDSSIIDLPYIAFNAGSLTDSITLATKDYLQVSHGQVIDFTKSKLLLDN